MAITQYRWDSRIPKDPLYLAQHDMGSAFNEFKCVRDIVNTVDLESQFRDVLPLEINCLSCLRLVQGKKLYFQQVLVMACARRSSRVMNWQGWPVTWSSKAAPRVDDPPKAGAKAFVYTFNCWYSKKCTLTLHEVEPDLWRTYATVSMHRAQCRQVNIKSSFGYRSNSEIPSKYNLRPLYWL